MLIGRFGSTSGRPYVEGRLILPQRGLQSDFSFLLDTGADSTFLTEDDAAVLRVDYARLGGRQQSQGIGGTSYDYVEPALIVFDDARNLYIYRIQLTIAEPNGKTAKLPSLLGRDVIGQWSLRYCFTEARLEAEVHTATVIQPRDGSFAYHPINPLITHE